MKIKHVSQHHLQPNNTKGFTLLEVIFVVVILGITTAIASPYLLDFLPNYTLKGAANDLRSHLQEARLHAVKSSKDVSIVFVKGVGGNLGHYFLDLDGNQSLNPVEPGEFRVDLANYEYGINLGYRNDVKNWNGDTITDPLMISGSLSYITFTPQGTATPASIYLINDEMFHVYATTIYASGAIKTRKYNGQLPFSKNNWN